MAYTFLTGDRTKLDGIEALADVTDWTNVAASLAAATGDVALNSQNITTVGTVDGRTVSTDGAKLDGIEASADVTDWTNVAAALASATGTLDCNGQTITNVGNVDGRDVSVDGTKLDGIEASADVTDFANVLSSLAVASLAVDFNNQQLTGVASPSLSTDAATKGYVDSAADKLNVVSKTFVDTPYTAVDADAVLYDVSGGSSQVNLPAAASNADAKIVVKKTDSSGNTVTIDGNGAETIDGATTRVLNSQYESITMVCDGSNWFII